MYRLLFVFSDLIARALALMGGFVLLIIIVLTCYSIFGRAMVPFDIGIRPIRGIYDITEIGMAVAIFAFLPYAQITDAHAKVDLFQPFMNDRLNLVLELIFNILMCFVAALGTWRLYLGMLDKQAFGETTLIAQIPVWQGYAAGLIGAVGFVFVAGFCVLRSTRRVIGLPEVERTQ